MLSKIEKEILQKKQSYQKIETNFKFHFTEECTARHALDKLSRHIKRIENNPLRRRSKRTLQRIHCICNSCKRKKI